jgi:hypothetical protein
VKVNEAEMTAPAEGAQMSRGFVGLVCPECGSDVSCISIDLQDMTDSEACRCSVCEGVFSLDKVRRLIEAWGPVLKWVEQAPVLK